MAHVLIYSAVHCAVYSQRAGVRAHCLVVGLHICAWHIYGSSSLPRCLGVAAACMVGGLADVDVREM